MKLVDMYYIFNIFGPVITAVGILFSLFVSIRTLKEIRRDRVLTQKPFLVFKQGGYVDKVLFEHAGKSSPGFDINYMKKILKDLPDDSISIRRQLIDENHKVRTFGILQNHGSGPAFNIKLAWIPIEIWIDDEKFLISKEKLKEPKYSEINNTRVVHDQIVYPRENTGILHWPLFIEKDYNLKISRVEGYFKIMYKDSLENSYCTYQRYHLFTNYRDDPPTLHVTFTDVISDPTNPDKI